MVSSSPFFQCIGTHKSVLYNIFKFENNGGKLKINTSKINRLQLAFNFQSTLLYRRCLGFPCIFQVIFKFNLLIKNTRLTSNKNGCDQIYI